MKALDYVTFRYRMPNGHDGHSFYTSDLECTQDHFEVTPQGRLVRIVSTDELARPLEDLNYSGWLDITSSADCFRLAFADGALLAIQLASDDDWTPFDSNNCTSS